jgi:hypothetical protein
MGLRYVAEHTNQLADSLGRLQANPDPDPRLRGTNDQYDAFRHAYSSARATELSNGNAHIAKKLGDWNENRHPGPPAERNMDQWNNNVGREEY